MINSAVRWLLYAIAVLWFGMSLTYPFGWDQGILAWAGHIVARGGMPFRDAWDMKGPVVYYVFALSETLFGENLWGIRIIDALFLAAATAAVVRAAAALTDAATARWSGIIFVLWYASHSYWHTAQPDGWVGMLLAVAVLPALRQPMSSGVWRIALLGAAVGVASLVKPVYTVFLLLPLLLAAAIGSRRYVAAVACVAGWLLPIALCAGWFSTHGAFTDLTDVYLRYPAVAYADIGRLSLQERARGLVEYLFQAPVIAVGLPVAIFGAMTLWRSHVVAARVLIVWVLSAAFIVLLQGRFFAYHWLPLLPAAVLLGAAGIHALLLRVQGLAVAMVCVVAAHCVAPIAFEELRFVSWLTGRTTTEAYYDAYGEAGNDMRAVTWLREHGTAGKLYVFGWNTSIAWLSHRETVSRFGFSMPLLLGQESGIRARYRDELLTALHADPPRYIVVGTQSQRILRRTLTLEDFPGLAALVAGSYSKVAEFGPIQIHELSLRAGRVQ